MVDFLDTIMSIPKRYIIALLIAFSYGLTYLLYIVFDKSLDWLVTNNVSTLKDRYTISRVCKFHNSSSQTSNEKQIATNHCFSDIG